MKKRGQRIQGIELISSLTDFPVISQLGDVSKSNSATGHLFQSQLHRPKENPFNGAVSDRKAQNSFLLSSTIGTPRSIENSNQMGFSPRRDAKEDTIFEKLKRKQFRVSAFLKSTDKSSHKLSPQQEGPLKLDIPAESPYKVANNDSVTKTHLTISHFQSIKDHIRSGRQVQNSAFPTVVW